MMNEILPSILGVRLINSIKNSIGICVFLLLVSKGQACPCDSTKQIQDYIDGANQIFVGTVIGVNTNWISGGMKYTFVVEQTWGRGADSLLVVNTGWDHECGSQFEEGEKYLVYGEKKFNLKTDACMGSKSLGEAGPDLELLGKGEAPRKSYTVPLAGWGMGLMVFLTMIFLAFVIFKNKLKTSNSTK